MPTSEDWVEQDVWSVKLSLYMSTLGLNCCGVPRLAVFQWNRKSQLEMEIDPRKSTGSVSKFKVCPNTPPAKAKQLSNNNNNTNKRESLPVQSITVTTGVGGTNNHPTKTCFESSWWSQMMKLPDVKHYTAEDIGS